MIIPDHKKAITVILGKMHDDGSESNVEGMPEHELDEHDAALKDIAEDMLRAVNNGSAHDLMMSLKAFMSEIEVADEEQDSEMME